MLKPKQLTQDSICLPPDMNLTAKRQQFEKANIKRMKVKEVISKVVRLCLYYISCLKLLNFFHDKNGF